MSHQEYKRIEKQHSDDKVLINKNDNEKLPDKILLNAHLYFMDIVRYFLENNKSGRILDYGCGNGSKSIHLSSQKWQLNGIDISSHAINIAKKYNKSFADYTVMDCEKMDFPDGYFDLVFDYGTFSSLDMVKAVPEILRVLKPTGALIAIETLGHNPLTNFKRKINIITGKRTKWAANHIMKMEDWKIIGKYFKETKMRFFGCFSLLCFPLIILCPDKYQNSFIKKIQRIDNSISNKILLKKMAFKTVIIYQNLKK